MEEDAWVIQTMRGRPVYCRSNSNQNEALRMRLAHCYGDKQPALIATSGMNALSTVLTVLMNKHLAGPFQGNPAGPKLRVVAGSELYCDTPRLLTALQGIYPIAVGPRLDATSSPEAILALFDQPHLPHVLLLESCTNPNGHVFDFDLLPQIRKRVHPSPLYVVVDNTWLTHAIFNPFAHPDVDVVVTSLTKYYSAGRCVAGAILCRDLSLYDLLLRHQIVHGIHVSPEYCARILEAMDTLDERVLRGSEATVGLARSLVQKGGMTLAHPSLPNHPSHALALKFFRKAGGVRLYPSVFSFVLPVDKEGAVAWMNSIDGVCKKTSFGSRHARFDTFPKQIGRKTKDPRTLCRLAVGYESDPESLAKEILFRAPPILRP